jgi:hypothetical protein
MTSDNDRIHIGLPYKVGRKVLSRDLVLLLSH